MLHEERNLSSGTKGGKVKRQVSLFVLEDFCFAIVSSSLEPVHRLLGFRSHAQITANISVQAIPNCHDKLLCLFSARSTISARIESYYSFNVVIDFLIH